MVLHFDVYRSLNVHSLPERIQRKFCVDSIIEYRFVCCILLMSAVEIASISKFLINNYSTNQRRLFWIEYWMEFDEIRLDHHIFYVTCSLIVLGVLPFRVDGDNVNWTFSIDSYGKWQLSRADTYYNKWYDLNTIWSEPTPIFLWSRNCRCSRNLNLNELPYWIRHSWTD